MANCRGKILNSNCGGILYVCPKCKKSGCRNASNGNVCNNNITNSGGMCISCGTQLKAL